MYPNREIAVGDVVWLSLEIFIGIRRCDAATPHRVCVRDETRETDNCGATSTPQPPTTRSDYDLNQLDYFQNPMCFVYTTAAGSWMWRTSCCATQRVRRARCTTALLAIVAMDVTRRFATGGYARIYVRMRTRTRSITIAAVYLCHAEGD